jgi:hypothetical protein
MTIAARAAWRDGCDAVRLEVVLFGANVVRGRVLAAERRIVEFGAVRVRGAALDDV